MSDDPFGADGDRRPGPPPPPPDLSPPPGYLQYGATPAFQGETQRIGTLAFAIRVVLALAAISAIVSLITELALREKARDFLADRMTQAAFEDSSSKFVAVSFAANVALVAALVLEILWSTRIAKNLQRNLRQPLVWKPGLTIVAWVVGCFTLGLLQFLMLREHWRASDPDVPVGDGSWRKGRVAPVIPAWLIASVSAAVVGAVAGNKAFGGVKVDTNSATRTLAQSVDQSTSLMTATTTLSLVSTALMFVIVGRLSARHQQLSGEA